MMTILRAAVAAAVLFGAAPVPFAAAQSRTPIDTGSMAYPEPLPQGSLTFRIPTQPNLPADTGSMAYQTSPTGGVIHGATAAN